MSGSDPASAPPEGDSPRPLVLRARHVLTPYEEVVNGAVVTAGERIVAVGPATAVSVPVGARVVDCGAATILPGFVDVHIHGSGGDSAMDGPEAVAAISRFVARHGVTSWLPTLTARATVPEMAAVIRSALAAAPAIGGAEVVGLHLEGPFVNPRRPGALRQEWFRTYAAVDVGALLAAAEGKLRLMTLAPELPGGLDLVRHLVTHRVTPSIGHSDATSTETEAAFAAGVSHATHAFNAMRPFHHRDPGVVGPLLLADNVTAELIADGVHAHPTAMRALIRAKTPRRVAIVTDAVAPAGLGDGDYEFDGRPITVKNGKATLADGTIAGSVATFDGNLRLVVRDCGLSLQHAAFMAATTPARSVGLGARKGVLAGGYDADVVVLDEGLNVRLTVARGRIVYDRIEGGDEGTQARARAPDRVVANEHGPAQ